MKIYVIASTEYEANMPDFFLMDDQGNYYGVNGNSYAVFNKFPKSIDYWFNAEGSDSGRYFNIDEVELTQQQVEEFDNLTKEFIKLNKETPKFDIPYPCSFGKWPSKKAYREAVDKWKEQHSEWAEKVDLHNYTGRLDEIWKQRASMFLSFSQKVTESISNNDYIKNL